MKRQLAASAILSVLSVLGAPALADTCTSVAQAATRSALESAEAAGRRTALVRTTCAGQRQTFVLHRLQTASGAGVLVRAIPGVKSGQIIAADDKREFSAATPARIIRVGQ
jgi:hypothetical protein